MRDLQCNRFSVETLVASLVLQADALHMNLCCLQLKYKTERETTFSQRAQLAVFVSVVHISDTVAQLLLGFNKTMPMSMMQKVQKTYRQHRSCQIITSFCQIQPAILSSLVLPSADMLLSQQKQQVDKVMQETAWALLVLLCKTRTIKAEYVSDHSVTTLPVA